MSESQQVSRELFGHCVIRQHTSAYVSIALSLVTVSESQQVSRELFRHCVARATEELKASHTSRHLARGLGPHTLVGSYLVTVSPVRLSAMLTYADVC